MDESIRDLRLSGSVNNIDTVTDIKSLRSERNSLAPISKLHPELLVSIFMLVHAPVFPISTPCIPNPEEQYQYDRTRLLQNLRWKKFISIIHVCRAWRTVAFDFPQFWSRIIFRSPLIIEKMLERSKRTPLSIRLFESDSIVRSPNGIYPLLSSKLFDMARLKELHVVLPSGPLRTVLTSLSNSQSKGENLHSLYIHLYPEADLDWPSSRSPDPPFEIPRNLFSHPIPSIRYLNIGYCSFDWDSLNDAMLLASSRMHSLKLAHVSKPTREQFYRLISGMSELEILHLDGVLPAVQDGISLNIMEPALTIHLPMICLCTILTSRLPEFMDFLRHVIFPTTTAALCLSLDSSGPESATEKRALIAALLDSCGLSEHNSHRSYSSLLLRAVISDPRAYELILGDVPITKSEPSQWSTANYPVVIRLIGLHQAPLCRSINALTIQGLKSIKISRWENFVSEEEWLTFLGKHSEVEHLYISLASQDYPPSFLFHALCNSSPAALCVASDADASRGSVEPTSSKWSTDFLSSDVICPSLSTLTLDGLDGRSFQRDKADILDFLVKRRNMGSPIRKLHFLCYYWRTSISAEDIAFIETLVPDVDFRG